MAKAMLKTFRCLLMISAVALTAPGYAAETFGFESRTPQAMDLSVAIKNDDIRFYLRGINFQPRHGRNSVSQDLRILMIHMQARW
jgi:hypothetical protein